MVTLHFSPKSSQPSASGTGADRRAHRRVKGPFDAAWNGDPNGRGLRLTDISEGGCYVQSMANLPAGDRLMMKLSLPQGGKVQVAGEVVSTDQGVGFAVRFVDLAGTQLEAIREAVQFVLSMESDKDSAAPRQAAMPKSGFVITR